MPKKIKPGSREDFFKALLEACPPDDDYSATLDLLVQGMAMLIARGADDSTRLAALMQVVNHLPMYLGQQLEHADGGWEVETKAVMNLDRPGKPQG